MPTVFPNDHGSPSDDRSTGRVRVVVMGVSGSGKTTVGTRVAELLDAQYLDADTAHPKANIDKMAAGLPLTDEDRQPWLERLRDELAAHERIVVTCSALKRSYRDVLRETDDIVIVHLEVDPETALDRVAGRDDHFMKAVMVDSQFAALEPPDDDEDDVVVVDAEQSVDAVVDSVLTVVGPPPSAGV